MRWFGRTRTSARKKDYRCECSLSYPENFKFMFEHRMLKWITINKGKFVVGSDQSSGQKKEINSLNTDFGNLILCNFQIKFPLNNLLPLQFVSVVC